MNILKWVVGILALLLVAFFMVGVFVPTFTYESRISVNKPAAHAFAVFMDDKKRADWMTGFKSIEIISGNRGEVGSIYKLAIEESGELMEMEETITAFKENVLFASKLVNDVMFADVEITFVESHGQTIITASNLVEGRNLIWKSLLVLFKGNISNQSQEMYENLKQVIEATELSMEPVGSNATAVMSAKEASN